MLGLFAPGPQQAPSAARQRNCVLHVSRLAVAIDFQVSDHRTIANYLEVIHRYERSQPRPELHFVLAGRQGQVVADLFAPKRESQQRSVGREGMATLQRIQPVPDIERPGWNFDVDPIQSHWYNTNF